MTQPCMIYLNFRIICFIERNYIMDDFLLFKEWLIQQPEYDELFIKYKTEPIYIFLAGSRSSQLLVSENSDYDVICVLDNNYKLFENKKIKKLYNDSLVHIYIWSYESLLKCILQEESSKYAILNQFFIHCFTNYIIYETEKGKELRNFIELNKTYFMEYGLYNLIQQSLYIFNMIENQIKPMASTKKLYYLLYCYKTIQELNGYKFIGSDELIKKIKLNQDLSEEEWGIVRNLSNILFNFYGNFNYAKINSLRLILLGMVNS